tara:strand:+ start:580 stop:1317 length:738 start_codon:yes stop_codon:yes gene_type:complete
MVKKKRTIRRRKKGKSNNYFTQETHDAIREYQNTESLEEMHEIYVSRILPAFNKLAENLIFIHRFARSVEAFGRLKNDCVTFLYETLHKFDPDRGTKAFSYFNVVAKNWLIIQSKKQTKQNRRLVSIDDLQESTGYEVNFHESFRVDPSQEKGMMREESKVALEEMLVEIKSKLRTEKEHSCIDAIISLFDRVDDLELLNKRAVFIYLRDISNLSPKQLSVTMSTIRKHYREISGKDDFVLFFGD